MVYGRPVRKSPLLHGRKSTPTPKFLGTAEAYFVCHIGPNFQIFFDLCLHWVSVVRDLKFCFFQFDLGVLRPIISNHETNPGGNDPASLTFLFAENPWSCDCEFVKEIQDFLYHRIPFLRDAELLYCGGEPVSTKNLAFK